LISTFTPSPPFQNIQTPSPTPVPSEAADKNFSKISTFYPFPKEKKPWEGTQGFNGIRLD
jgi:hypothetical protein